MELGSKGLAKTHKNHGIYYNDDRGFYGAIYRQNRQNIAVFAYRPSLFLPG
jgi:hypothetical protein